MVAKQQQELLLAGKANTTPTASFPPGPCCAQAAYRGEWRDHSGDGSLLAVGREMDFTVLSLSLGMEEPCKVPSC